MHAHKLSPYVKIKMLQILKKTVYVLHEDFKSIQDVLSLSLDSKLQDALDAQKYRHQRES